MAPIEHDHNAVELCLSSRPAQVDPPDPLRDHDPGHHLRHPHKPSHQRQRNPPPASPRPPPPTPPRRRARSSPPSSSTSPPPLQEVHALAAEARAAGSLSEVPRELITYVDGGRNPDIYTREFVELVRRKNQLMKGKMQAFGSFRDILAREIASANPELREDVARVVVGTGGCGPLRGAEGAQ
ncbi:hypothetical protein OPQ81_008066 [Rhizoctonia solani]|nr:hypothetical protein OPQ81_008066 [Rhizoctonia solani]